MTHVRPFWLSKHDKESIETHPGWIWRNVGAPKRVITDLGKIQKGHKFVSYAHKTSERRDSIPCSEMYGFYRVSDRCRRCESMGMIFGS